MKLADHTRGYLGTPEGRSPGIHLLPKAEAHNYSWLTPPSSDMRPAEIQLIGGRTAVQTLTRLMRFIFFARIGSSFWCKHLIPSSGLTGGVSSVVSARLSLFSGSATGKIGLAKCIQP